MPQRTDRTHKYPKEPIEFPAPPPKSPHIAILREHSRVPLPTLHIHSLEVVLVEEVDHLGLEVGLPAVVVAQLAVCSLAEREHIAESKIRSTRRR